MARKRISSGNINRLRKANESIFALPNATRGKNKPKWVTQKVTNLKPNTKYKVMLDNYPGNNFEDLTDYAKPVGESVKVNTHRQGNRGRLTYLKSDANGKLQFKVRPFGTDDATTTGDISSGSKSFANMWKYWHTRTQNSDRGRDKIKLIAYSAIDNPDSANKVKSLKTSITPTITINDAGGSVEVSPETPNVVKALPPGIVCDCTLAAPGYQDNVLQIDSISSYYQTFFIDSSKVDNSDTVDLLDIVLYVRSKPLIKTNASGIANPGINISILECEADGTPIINSRLVGSVVQLDYNQIKASPLATSGTAFPFNGPLRVKTNRYYAVSIKLEDSNYVLWQNKKGDLTLVDGVKTEERSQGSSKGHKGDVYFYDSNKAKKKNNSESAWLPKNDLDIKFDVNVAEYTVSDIDVTLHNASYEFFNLSNTTPDWEPGEEVYKDVNPTMTNVFIAAGTNKIIAGSAIPDLEDGTKIILIDSTDSTIQQVFTVDKSLSSNPSNTIMYVSQLAERSIGNSSSSPNGSMLVTVVGELEYYDYYFKNIRLADSSVNATQYTANSDLRFAVGDTIVGVESGTTGYIDSYNPLPISVVRTNWNATLPAQFKPATSYNLSYETPVNGIYALGNTDKIFYLNAPNHVRDYEGTIISRSQEVDQDISDGFNANNEFKSGQINLTYSYQGANTRSYSAPTIDLSEMDLVCHRWLINNDSSNEHLNSGNALTRHISNTLELGNGNNAEDVRVILNAWRPRNTDVEVYAKIQNSADPDAFDDKQWTKLEAVSGGDQYSKVESPYDYKEIEFGFATTTSSVNQVGTYTTELANNIIVGSSDSDPDLIAANDVIKISSPLFPENYQVFSVETSNTTTITLSEPISNNNIVGEGFIVSKLDAPQTVFKNPDNYNAARYYNSEGTPYDTYNKVAIKLVLLADSRKLVPKVDDYRVIGVTA